MGITDDKPVKSIEYRGGALADVDSDMARDGRQKLIQHMKDKWGTANVATIGTYGTMHAKSAIRKVGKTLGYDIGIYEDVIKHIPEPAAGKAWTIDKLKAIKEFKHIYDTDNDAQRIINMAEKMEGIVDNRGKHAAGVVVYPEPVNNLIPTWKDGEIDTLEFEMDDTESLGFVKYDFLGLKTLDVLDLCVKMIKKNHDADIVLNDIPLDDPGIYRLLSGGNLLGVFQLEGAGMSDACVKFKPTQFTDIALISAGYRPGPLKFLQSIISNRNNNGHSVTPHSTRFEVLTDILSDTYGMMIYQEQVMSMAQMLGGFDEFESDKFRKAIGKKKADDMEIMKEKFKTGAIEKGMSDDDVELLLEEITEFSKYAFNLSHAIAYSMLSAQTAYLKFYYPEEFFAANMTVDSNDVESVSKFMEEARTVWDIKLVPPYVNNAHMGFSVMEKGVIVMGMSGIKGLSNSSSGEIIEERENGEFLSMSDFILRTNSKKGVVESLAKVGGFDKINTRGKYLSEGYIEELIKIIRVFRTKELDASVMGSNEYVKLPYVPDLPMDVKLRHEMDVANTWVSSSPFELYKNEIENVIGTDTLVGYIKTRAAFKTGTGGRINLLTKNGVEELLMFRKSWDSIKFINSEMLVAVHYEMAGAPNNQFKRGNKAREIRVEKSLNNILNINITNGVDISNLYEYVNSIEGGLVQPLSITGKRSKFSTYIFNNK